MSSSDVSAVTSHFPTPNEGFITTASGAISSGAATVPLASVTNLVNGTVFIGIIEPGLTNEQTFTGIVDTVGLQITGVKWTRGTNIGHAGGVTIVDYVTGSVVKMITKGLLVSHDQDGTLKDGAVDNAGVLASNVVTTSKIIDSAITFAKFLPTIFSGQVTTYSNPGSAGGTFNYINLGGIKLFWGQTSTLSVSGSGGQTGTSAVITLPVGFLSTIQALNHSCQSQANTNSLYSILVGASTSSLSVALRQEAGANGQAGVCVWIVGT